MSISPPFETKAIEESKEENEECKEIFEEHKHLIKTLPTANGWMVKDLYNYNGFWLGTHALKYNLLINTCFQSHPTDIFLASFVKAGTTWLKSLMFSTFNRDSFTFSDHYLHQHGPHDAIPVIESDSDLIQGITSHPSPRLLSTHLARTLLPICITSCKFVYVCRDPKDVLVSKWIFMNKVRSNELPPLTLDEAFMRFCDGVSEYGPFWEHVLSYWRASLETPDKILFLKYEEIMNNPAAELRKLAAFMGKPFTVEEEENGIVDEIVKLCSFENLSHFEINKKGVQTFGKVAKVENHKFFRKGKIGDWKNYLSDEMKQRIDAITSEKFKGSGLILGSEL